MFTDSAVSGLFLGFALPKTTLAEIMDYLPLINIDRGLPLCLLLRLCKGLMFETAC